MSTTATIPLLATPTKHTFFYTLVHETIPSLFRVKSPAWIIGANAVLQIGVPLVQDALDLDAPELAPVIDPILDRVTVGMGTLALMAKQGGAHPTLLSTVQALQANLTALEAAANVADPATKAKLSANIQLLVSELSALESMLPAQTSAPAAAPTS